ncbi:MAG: hypothetical protein JNM18_21185 [Planctomycetaceae bacterium]|nr:hypothetical protein [Planctomycetaceae bacterium]
MKTHVLKGSKQEIADSLVRITGDICEVIVFEAEPIFPATPSANNDDVFAEMRPFMVEGPHLDDSRATIYSRLEGE